MKGRGKEGGRKTTNEREGGRKREKLRCVQPNQNGISLLRLHKHYMLHSTLAKNYT